VAPLVPHFLSPWCAALRNIRDDLEKEQAFRGLLAVVHKAPEAAVSSFAALAGEVAAAVVMLLDADCIWLALPASCASLCSAGPTNW
jgi:hypothetical protein